MGSDLSKPRSVFNLQRSHPTRFRRAVHLNSSAPTSDSFSDDGNYNDLRTYNKNLPSQSQKTLARNFLTGRKRSKSSTSFALDEYPSEQRSFWKDIELERLRRPGNVTLAFGQIIYEIVKASFNGILHMSPVIETLSVGGRVLDIGCGNAKWSFDMCVAYPNSHVTGLDLTNTLIKDSPPKNFKFQKGNSLTRLPFSDDTFDLVYTTGLMFNTRKEYSDAIITELIRIIKPGGYFELVEHDIRGHKPGPKFTAIMNQMRTIAVNPDPDLFPTLSKRLSSHPALLFVQTEYKNLRIGPYGGWAYLTTRTLMQSFEGLVAKGLGLEKSEYMDYVEKCMEECCEHGTDHAVWVAWGQKSRLS